MLTTIMTWVFNIETQQSNSKGFSFVGAQIEAGLVVIVVSSAIPN